MGRKPGSKSPTLPGAAAEPTTRSSGISWTPAKERPSAPAAASAASIDASPRPRRVSVPSTALRKARKRAASKSSRARRVSSTAHLKARYSPLQEGFLRLGVEEVEPAGVEAELDLVADRHLEPRVDPGRDGIGADLPVEELVGAEPFDDVDLHVERGFLGGPVGDRLRAEAEGALRGIDRLG